MNHKVEVNHKMESQNTTAFAIPAMVGQQNGYGQIEVLFLDTSNLVLEHAAPGATLTSSPLELQILSNDQVDEREKSVHVCSFCQKFSQKENIIVAHIEAVHSESLLMGTPAKKFVTRLQSLQCEEEKKQAPKKRGRPKKCDQQRTEAVKTTPEPEPVPSSDGYFWCQKCYKYFNKARQLMRHICLKNDDQEQFQNDDVFDMDFEEEENLDMDNSKDFKMHMKIDGNHQSITKICDKKSFSINQVTATSYHLKEDKCDVPIFSNEDEKASFEEHLKNVDFSCVDHLYVREGRKRQGRRKKSCKHDQTYLYSCEICKKVFKSQSHIRMHCLTHTTLKPFTCLKCPYSTNTKGNLYIHMRKHTGNVFRCGYCEFKTGNRSHLVEHEETHLSNSWNCEQCKNTYKTLKSLMNHVRMYHTNNPGKKYLSLLTWKSKQRNIITYDNSYKNPNLVCNSENSIAKEVDNELQFLESVVVNEQTFEPPSSNHSITNEIGNELQFLESVVVNEQTFEPPSSNRSQSDKNGGPPLLNLNQSTNDVEPAVLSHSQTNKNFQSQILNHSHLNQIPSKSTFKKFPQNSKPVIFKNINNDVEQNDQMLLLNGSCNDTREAYIEPPVLCNAYQQSQSTSSYLENYPQETLSEKVQFQFSEPKYQSSLPKNEQLEFSKSNFQEPMTEHSPIQFSDDFNSSVLKNCLQDSDFVDTAALIDNTLMGQCTQQLCQVNPAFTGNSPLLEKGEISDMTQALLPVETHENESQLHIRLDSEKYQEETESAETKLFEKCRRLQAYVCCVCTTIFIDPAKLKEHLKEHASGDGSYNNVTKQPEEQHVQQDKKPEEVASSIDSVCKELTDTLTEEQMFDKHLEELYTSSLDMSWYLPELSVNVECLIDSVLEDSLNFPLSEKYDASDELRSKASEDNILQYFDDI